MNEEVSTEASSRKGSESDSQGEGGERIVEVKELEEHGIIDEQKIDLWVSMSGKVYDVSNLME